MLAMYLGIYTFILALLWGLFIIAKIHAYKFKNFSSNIVQLTNILLVFLLILSSLGYILIFFSSSNITVVENYSSPDVLEVNY